MVRFIIYNLGGTKNFNNKGDRKTSNMPSVDKNWLEEGVNLKLAIKITDVIN